MRTFAYVLIAVSLTLGSIAATSAYVPRLSSLDTPLTLNAEAGRNPAAPGQPLVTPDQQEEPVVLTDTLVRRLADAGVTRVRVREFAFGRWDHGWLFLLSVAGLLIGGLMIRRMDAEAIRRRLQREVPHEESPEAAIEKTRQELLALLRDLEAESSDDRAQRQITRRLDALHDTQLAAFVEARQEFIGRFGLAGFARIMDAFAAAERQINRAWSAAADEDLHEAKISLAAAAEMMQEVQRRLRPEAGVAEKN